MKRVAVVGGGIAGLALANALRRRDAAARGVEVVVLERARRPGGNIRSERICGYLCEWGPNGFLDSVPETLELVRELGLEARLQPSDLSSRRRYIFRRGRLHQVPMGPGAFLASGLLSVPGKLRVALEPFAAGRPARDESIHEFAARRIGREAAEVLVGSMVSGVFAGDARTLSLRACFPKMWQMESEHGGLFRALFARMRAGRHRRGEGVGSPSGRLTSFREGTEELVQALATRIDGSLRTGAEVVALRPGASGHRLVCADGAEIEADVVVLAGGASQASRIVAPADAELAGLLAEIPNAGLAVVCLGYDEGALPRLPDGFGFLAPRGEGLRILGALWDSNIFPGRAPAGRMLVRAMIGGAHDSEAVALSEEELLSITRADLQAAVGIAAEPVFAKVFRHRLGIPQYTLGHLERLARIDARLAGLRGVYVAGNSYRGVAINSCVAESGPLAERILADLS